MATTLTRPQFDQACKAYLASHPNACLSDVNRRPSGWVWCEHPYIPGLGYLSRTVRIPAKPAPEDAEGEEHSKDLADEDDAAVCRTVQDTLVCNQYVVHSATFQVPAFYFTLHDSSGSPLCLDEIAKSPLFRPLALPSADGNTFALTLPDSALALLSQGDHPTLGTPSWYFHPCQTSEMVGEIMAEREDGRDDVLQWIETWFMVMGNIVDFFAGS